MNESNKENTPLHAFETFLILFLVILVVVAAIGLLVLVSVNLNNRNIQITGSTESMRPIPTEDYFNNCSNNASFVKCDWNNSIASCSADGKPIQITGFIQNVT
jgi:hypothetical protein